VARFIGLPLIVGIKLCQACRRQHGCGLISAMLTNLYGPGDNFHLEQSHLIPAMLCKICDVKQRGNRAVTLWGTGRPVREFLHVGDLADALLQHNSRESHVNVGVGQDLSIREPAELVR
jgi:GDP-L-fucose synthase